MDVVGVVVFNEVIKCQPLQFFERRRFNDHELGIRILSCNIFACVSGLLTEETLKQTTCDCEFPELASASTSPQKFHNCLRGRALWSQVDTDFYNAGAATAHQAPDQ